jgi:hypothetical protein
MHVHMNGAEDIVSHYLPNTFATAAALVSRFVRSCQRFHMNHCDYGSVSLGLFDDIVLSTICVCLVFLFAAYLHFVRLRLAGPSSRRLAFSRLMMSRLVASHAYRMVLALASFRFGCVRLLGCLD